MSLKFKYTLSLGVFLLVSIVLFFIVFSRTNHQRDTALHTLREELVSVIKEELKWTTQTMLQVINARLAEAKTEEARIELIRDLVRDVRIFDDNSGYYFVYDKDGNTIALPPAPKLHGENRMSLRDANGVYIMKDLISASKKQGGGFTIYNYPKPGQEEPSPKLSYVASIPGTPYFIGSGVYIDNVDQKVRRPVSRLITRQRPQWAISSRVFLSWR